MPRRDRRGSGRTGERGAGTAYRRGSGGFKDQVRRPGGGLMVLLCAVPSKEPPDVYYYL